MTRPLGLSDLAQPPIYVEDMLLRYERRMKAGEDMQSLEDDMALELGNREHAQSILSTLGMLFLLSRADPPKGEGE
jgi:hypothetical protein